MASGNWGILVVLPRPGCFTADMCLCVGVSSGPRLYADNAFQELRTDSSR